MTFETQADKAAFLADFGTEVTGSANFRAIYDHEYTEINEISGENPVLMAPYQAPVTGLQVGDVLQVEGKDYNFVRNEPDGTGWVMVILEEQ